MSERKITAFLMFLDSNLMRMLTERRGTDYKDAAKLLYKSKLYSQLEKEETKLWHLSAETLYSLLDEEVQTGTITYPEEN
ncbi:MAG: hypothetical protein LBT20_01915 [Clostridiales bacterium]|jgi:hypothetical protein|nr:hypothetical protein [Clostridiales bacterium]